MSVGIFCQCCLNKCDDQVNMSSPVNNQGILEVYEEMLQYSTGIKLQKEDNINYICKPCICKLRESCIFKNQVQEVQWRLSINSLKNYLQTVPDHNYDDYFNPFVETRNGSKSQPALFKCEICLAKFNTKEDYDLHTEYCNNEIVSEHDKDDASYKGFSDPDSDYNDEINFTRNLRSSKPLPEELKIEIETKKPSFKCKKCTATFDKKEEFDLHRKSCVTKFICPHCGKSFQNKSRFEGHVITHGEKVQCEICNKFIAKYNLNTHKKRHDDKIVFQCTKCSETFKRYSHRRKHMIDAHGFVRRIYQCTICPKTYLTTSARKVHLRREHFRETRHACTECDMRFYCISQLKVHMLVHTGEKNFECDFCHKRYGRKKTLKEHLKIHLNIKDHKCHICGKAFTNKCGLTEHLKTHKK